MTDVAASLGVFINRRWLGGRRLAVVASLLMIIFAAGTALYLVRGFDRQVDEMVHSYDVRDAARDLSQAITDAETGQRGFLLTLDERYLAPYNLALATMDSRLQTLMGLTEDNPLQHLRVVAISGDIGSKRIEMETTVTLAKDGHLQQAKEMILTDTGQRQMDSIRQGISQLLETQSQLLVERNDNLAHLRTMLIGVILVALAAGASLTYALFTRSQKQVSALARSQSFLLSENEELEARVQERTAEFEEASRHAERERQRVETLLQDSNHRIGNSLATVSSLLGLQMMRTRSGEVKTALEAARSRVQVIASGHRRLRLGDDLETTRADDFLNTVVEDLELNRPDGSTIHFETAFEPLFIKARDATTVGIVLGELVTNAVKHAFPNQRGGNIWTRLYRDAAGQVTLVVEDDGIGIRPPDDDEKPDGLGSLIIKQLAQQFGGSPDISPRAGGGTRTTISLPELPVVEKVAEAS
ncbi:MAG TPA: CHASE3 domain-containing protein [Devosiaceae bacterium]|jgi:two-component sensor histidine kinase/CHASE3 domain sensor protein